MKSKGDAEGLEGYGGAADGRDQGGGVYLADQVEMVGPWESV